MRLYNINVNVNFLRDKDDDAGQNLTVKPTAFMKLYSDGVDVTGGNVKLTDMLTLTMELDADYLRKLTFLLDTDHQKF